MGKYLLSAKVGTYTDKHNQEKGRYKQVGTIEENQKGMYARFDLVTLYGLCALELGKGNSEMFVSIFEPKNNEQTQSKENQSNDWSDDDVLF